MAERSISLRQRKIVLLGDSKTGKHCYMSRLINNKYPNDFSSNKGYDSLTKKFQIDNGSEIPIQITVIHGSERGKTKMKKFYKNIDGYIIMFDITSPESYDNVLGWKKNVDDENKPSQLPCILLATKCDLEKHEEIKAQMEVINNYCELFGFSSCFEVSSQDNVGIQQSFDHFIRELVQSKTRPRTCTPPTPPISPSMPPPAPPPQELTFKILVIGELGTGKTAIIQRYSKNTFPGHYRSTIGSDLALKKVQYGNSIINIHIWDIAGDERFGTMTRLFYRDAAGCIIVFDVSRANTLNGAIKWKDDFDAKVNYDANHRVPCILVGNKCDLMKDGIVASSAHMTEFCRARHFIRWFETSAKESININEIFSFLMDEIMNNLENNVEGGRPRTFSEPFRLPEDNTGNMQPHICCNT